MNIDKKFLLVCLQLIIVLVMQSMIVEGMMLTKDAPIESSRYPGSLQLAHHSTKGSRLHQENQKSNQRVCRLYHHCSYRDVVITTRNITTGNNTDMFGNLVLESMWKYNTVVIRIRGSASENYLCYNRRGRLKSKPARRAKGRLCEFTEEPGQLGSFLYRSVQDPEWVLGFNPKGNPLSGKSHRRQDCFRFTKTKLTLNNHHTTTAADFLTRNEANEYNILDHNNNRRLARRPSPTLPPARIEAVATDSDSTSLQFFTTQQQQQQQHHSMRHNKKSHRHRHRRPHFQRTSADR